MLYYNMGYTNPSRFTNKSRAYKSKRGKSNNQKRVNWAKKSALRRKSASSQARQISAIAKTVDSLDTQINPRTGKYTLAQGLFINSGAIRIGYSVLTGTSPTQVWPFMPSQVASTSIPESYPAWDRWGPGVSSGTDEPDGQASSFDISEISTCNRAKVGTMKLEMAFSANNEPTPIQITVQIVTFTNEEVATYLTGQFGVGLENFPPVDATHQMACRGDSVANPAPSMGGCLHLNPAYFRVIKEQRFVLANKTYTTAGTPVTNSKDTYRAITWNIPMGNVLNARDRGNWTREPADTGYGLSNRRFLFITSDNVTDEGESPSVNIFASCIMYGQK